MIQSVLDVTSQEVAMLGQIERRELFIALQQAEVELSVGLNEWLKGVTDGGERFTAVQLRNALANTRRAMQTVRSLEPRMTGALETLRATAARVSGAHVEFQMLQFSHIFDGEIKPINVRVAATFARGNKLLIRKHKRSARRYAGAMEQHIKRQLTLGVINGESFDQMATRLMRLGPRSIGMSTLTPAEGMARGLMQMPRSQAMRIVRTEAINAYNTYHLESINDLADDDEGIRKRWDSSLDRRGCVACRELDEEVQKVDEKFSTGVMHPTQHPHCRCTVVPWRDDWKHDSMKSTGTEGIDAPTPKPLQLGRTPAAAQ